MTLRWRWEPWSADCVLRGHTEEIASLQYVDHGNKLLSHSEDNTVRLWECASGREVCCIPDVPVVHGFDSPIFRDPKLSPDGRSLVVFKKDSIEIHDVAGQEKPRIIDISNQWAEDACFNPSGKLLITRRKLHAWDAQTAQPVLALSAPISQGYSSGAAFTHVDLLKSVHTETLSDYVKALEGVAINAIVSPDATRVLTWIDGARHAQLWDIESGKRLMAFNPTHDFKPGKLWGPTQLEMSFDGIRVAGRFENDFETLRVWDLANGKQLCAIPEIKETECLLSPRGRDVLVYRKLDVNHYGPLLIYAAETGKLRGELPITNAVWKISGNETRLISVPWNFDRAPMDVSIWDYETLTPVASIPHTSTSSHLAFAEDGTRFVCESTDHTIVEWRRHRPEYKWGVLVLPELWLTIVLGIAFVVSFIRRSVTAR